MTQSSTRLARQQDAPLTEQTQQNVRLASPPVDIFENPDEILLVADLPGVAAEGLEVRLDGSELSIRGAQSASEFAEAPEPLTFVRAFQVPKTIDPEGVKAELSGGLLRLHLAKSEAAKPRKIEIQAH